MPQLKVLIYSYAIRHKPTNLYMPNTKRGRGYTSIEIKDFMPIGGNHLPRLFGTRSAASKALKCWLKGAWVAIWEEDNDWQPNKYKIGAAPSTTPPLDRVESDMEIVEFEMWEQ